MGPRVKSSVAKWTKIAKAKKGDGKAKPSEPEGKPPKPAATRTVKGPIPSSNDVNAPERPRGGKSKSGSKRPRAEAGDEQQVAQPSAKKKRKQSPAARKGPARDKDGKTLPLPPAKTAKWKVMSKDSQDYLKILISGTVLSLLSKKIPEKESVQKHLRILEGKLLAHCQDLKVPPALPKLYKNIAGKVAQETEQMEHSQVTLETLQDKVDESVQDLKRMGEEIETLQEKIRILKSQQDDEEEDSGEALDNAENILSMELPKASYDAPLLQEEMLKVTNQEVLLQELCSSRSLPVTRDVRALIEQAYAEVDNLCVQEKPTSSKEHHLATKTNNVRHH
ncbi:centromere protein Q isoform X2 [Lissotriton helveticus]